MYAVKEIFYTLQGEGAQTGRAAVFCRFAGCNLWSGREADRAAAVCKFCDTDFADTNGPGGGKFASAEELAEAVEEEWRARAIPGLKSETGGTRDSSRTTADPHSTQIASAIFAQGRLSTEPFAPRATGSAQDDKNGVNAQRDGAGKRFVVCTGGEPLLQLDAPLIAALHTRGFEIAVETNGTVAAPEGLDWVCVSPKAGTELKVRTGDELKLVYPQAGAEPERFADLAFRHFFVQPMDGPARAENTRLAVEYCLAHPQWRVSLQTHKLMGIP
jgi:7-carboxy-7-deazaguanine synthase